MAAVAALGPAAADVAMDVDVQREGANAFRLMSLPAGALSHVAMKMGRRSRIVSKPLLDAYGPLVCGLKSGARTGPAQLQQLLLSRSAERLRHVTSLQLVGDNREVICDNWPAFIGAVCQALPNLKSVELAALMEGPHLAMLAPLSPTLTSLSISPKLVIDRFWLDTTFFQSLQQLSNLRSLTLDGEVRFTPVPKTLLALQHVLGDLPHLAHLSWYAGHYAYDPRFLPDLAAHVPQLTSLVIGNLAGTWDDNTTEAVQQGLPHLRTLSFSARTLSHPTHLQPILAGLAQCSGIRAMNMTLDMTTWADVDTSYLQELARLRLVSLVATAANADSITQTEPLMCALQAQTQLTKLHFTYYSSYRSSHAFSSHHLPNSLVNLQVDGDWDPATLIARARQLHCLRVLHLLRPSNAATEWSPAATEQLATLTHLHALSIEVQSPPPPHLLLAVSNLPTLGQLRLMVHPPYGRELLLRTCYGDVTDHDLLHLVALREHLTSLSLGGMHLVSVPGVAALVEELSNLRQLDLEQFSGLRGEEAEGALVEAMLPLLSSLSSLRLDCTVVARDVRHTLVSMANARGCTLKLSGW